MQMFLVLDRLLFPCVGRLSFVMKNIKFLKYLHFNIYKLQIIKNAI